MSIEAFGKPEAYGVELAPYVKPQKREVHVTGYVVIEIVVDVWTEVDGDLSDEEIKRDVMDDLDVGEGEIERASLEIEGEPSNKILLRLEQKRERERLAAWNAGEPIRGEI